MTDRAAAERPDPEIPESMQRQVDFYDGPECTHDLPSPAHDRAAARDVAGIGALLTKTEAVVEEALFYDDPQGRGRVFKWLDQWTRKDGDPYLPLAAEAVAKALLRSGLLNQAAELDRQRALIAAVLAVLRELVELQAPESELPMPLSEWQTRWGNAWTDARRALDEGEVI